MKDYYDYYKTDRGYHARSLNSNDGWAVQAGTSLANEKAVYACLNYGEAFCPGEIEERSICIDGDIGDILNA